MNTFTSRLGRTLAQPSPSSGAAGERFGRVREPLQVAARPCGAGGPSRAAGVGRCRRRACSRALSAAAPPGRGGHPGPAPVFLRAQTWGWGRGGPSAGTERVRSPGGQETGPPGHQTKRGVLACRSRGPQLRRRPAAPPGPSLRGAVPAPRRIPTACSLLSWRIGSASVLRALGFRQ